MSNDDDWRKKVGEFFSEADEDELRLLVSLNDKHSSFSSENFIEVEESISPKVWGMAIEEGIVEESGTGYTLNARSEISEYLSGNWSFENDEEDEDENTKTEVKDKDLPNIDHSKANWNKKDKAVALCGAIGILGFSFAPVRNIIYGVLGLVLNPLSNVIPFFAVVFIIAIFTSFWSTYVREGFIDGDVSEFKEYMNKLAGDDGDGGMFSTPKGLSDEAQEKRMKAQQSMMKMQMKPLGWTMVMTIPMVIWIFTTANFGGVSTIVFPIIGEYAWASSAIGPIQTWIIWYASCSIVLSQIVKRIFEF